jgi:recA bacterial DNA recombination protein
MAVLARRLDTQFQLLEAPPILKPAITPQIVESGEGEAIRNLRATLEASIASKLTSGAELVRAVARQRREEILPTTIPPLDALLGGGLARGKMTEIAGRGTRFSIVIAILAAATSIGEAAALIDASDSFDPQLAEAAGVDLRRLLWVRPQTMKETVTAAEMTGATGFQLVIIDMGSRRPPGRRVPDAVWVRMARVAESHGATILVSAPYALTGTTSEAMILAYAPRPHWLGRGNAPRVLAGIEMKLKLEKHRRLRPGQSTTVFFQCEEAVGSTQSAVIAVPTADSRHPTAAASRKAS